MVPEIEEREACHFCGYTWREWLTLERDERIDGIAHYRIRRLIEAHSHDAVEEDSERQRREARARANND